MSRITLRVWILCSLICLISHRAQSSDQDSLLFEKILQRICQMAKKALLNQHLEPGEIGKKLESVQHKLSSQLKDKAENQSSSINAHVLLVVKGISLLAKSDNYQTICVETNRVSERRSLSEDVQYLEIENTIENTTKGKEIIENDSREDQTEIERGKSIEIATEPNPGEQDTSTVSDIFNKIEMLVARATRNATTYEQKVKNVEKMRSQIVNTYKRTSKVKDNQKKNENAELIVRGINLVLDRVLANEERRMTFRQNDEANDIGKEALSETSVSVNTTNNTNYSTTTPSSIQGVTTDYGCKDVLKETCEDLRRLDKFKCEYDGSTVMTHQVCDGNIDCPDGSDEKNCIQQVISKIHRATEVMSKVELSRFCFKTLIDNSLLSRQGELLTSLLNTQVQFLQKHAVHIQPTTVPARTPSSTEKSSRTENQLVNEIVEEISIVVRTFATTLLGAICVEVDEPVLLDVDKLINFGIDDEIDRVIGPEIRSKWLENSCDCSGPLCVNATNCPPDCKRFCYQVHSLTHFGCSSVKRGQDSISIDLVCDGKLDCNDETDEMNCPTNITANKIESSNIFDSIVQTVMAKFGTPEFEPIRRYLHDLTVQIQKLQRSGLHRQIDLEAYKGWRDRCYKTLRIIYEEFLQHSVNKAEREEVYEFLMSVGKKIMVALKKVNVGNKKLISAEDCYCRGSECAQPQCPIRCIRMCVVKTMLTHYTCNGTSNISIPVDAICNAKINCPNAEDELNCKPDICRVHHLKVLRHNIQNVGDRYKGTVLGDALGTWKTKVGANLLVLEQREQRLTSKALKTAIYEILNDLSLTFTTLENYRRKLDTEIILKKFNKLAQRIIDTVKECTK